MKHQTVRQGQTTTPGTTCPTLFDKCVVSLTSPADYVTLKMQEMGPTIFTVFLRFFYGFFTVFLRFLHVYLLHSDVPRVSKTTTTLVTSTRYSAKN